LFFLTIVFEIYPFNLKFASTGFTGIHCGLAAGSVQRQLVAGNFSLGPTAAAAPPKGVSSFGSPFG
jgi:hypothetical protein